MLNTGGKPGLVYPNPSNADEKKWGVGNIFGSVPGANRMAKLGRNRGDGDHSDEIKTQLKNRGCPVGLVHFTCGHGRPRAIGVLSGGADNIYKLSLAFPELNT